MKTHKIDPRTLVQLSPIQPFINEVEKGGVGCSGVLQRLDAHSLALKFMNFSSEDETLPPKVQRALEFLRTFRRTYKARKVANERESIESKAYNPPDLSGVDRLLTDVSISEEFHVTSQEILDDTEQPTKKQYNTCLAIVAGRVLYSNAQRPGAVAGALMSEFEEGFRARRKGDSYVTLRVKSHKTGSSESAKLILPRKILKMLAVWEEVRSKVAPDSPYLFPDFKGRQISHLIRVVATYAEARDIALPTSQVVRTTVELHTKKMAAPVQEAVSRSLSHSQATVLKHYRANDKQSGHLAYEAIQEIVSSKTGDQETAEEPGTSGASPRKAKRRRFTQEETDITEHFSSQLQRKELPVTAESERFLANQPPHLFPGRRAHDIYDKVRNLIGSEGGSLPSLHLISTLTRVITTTQHFDAVHHLPILHPGHPSCSANTSAVSPKRPLTNVSLTPMPVTAWGQTAR